MRQPEHDEQVVFMKRMALDPRTRDVLMTAIPNGGHRFHAVAAKLKAEGVKPGVPDVLIFTPTPQYHGLALEFKVRPNKASALQLEWLLALRNVGWKTLMVFSAEEAFDAVGDYLGFLPARRVEA